MPLPLIASFKPEVRRTLPVLIFFRLIGNAAFRYGFTFLPALASGSGLSVEAMGRLLSARDLGALLAPKVGQLSDRHSAARLMSITSAVLVGGLVVASFGSTGLIVGFLLVGFGKLGYDVSMNAWVGDVVAYERRGHATGLVELSWAGSALLVLPILGLLIDQVGWWAASLFLAAAGGPLAIIITRQVSPGSVGHGASPRGRRPNLTMGIAFTLLALALMSVSSQLLIVGHGLWLADTYDLDATRVGFAVIAIGAIEAVGSVASARFTDRLGKKNSMAMGMSLLAGALALMAWLSSPPLAGGIGLLVGAFLGFEFALVSALPLLSELDPGARAQMLGWALGLSTVVRSFSSLAGVWLYLSHGVSWLAGVGSAAAMLAVVVLVLVVPEPRPAGPNLVMN